MPNSWYAYLGGANGDPRLSSDYFIVTLRPTCTTGNKICAIYSPNGDINPSAPLSINLLRYISNFSVSGVPQPDIPGTKKYVYGKN